MTIMEMSLTIKLEIMKKKSMQKIVNWHP